jgi:hypothetical protein
MSFQGHTVVDSDSEGIDSAMTLSSINIVFQWPQESKVLEGTEMQGILL